MAGTLPVSEGIKRSFRETKGNSEARIEITRHQTAREPATEHPILSLDAVTGTITGYNFEGGLEVIIPRP